MNSQSLKNIASWLLLSIAALPILHPPITILIVALIASILVALAAFRPKKVSLPWLLCGVGLLILSFAKIPDEWSDKTRLIALLGVCIVVLAITNELFFYISAQQERQRQD